MMDDAVQSAPPTADSAPEPAAPVAPSEPTLPSVEFTPITEQPASVEPVSVIPEKSQSAPEATVEPPEVEVEVPEPQPTTQSTSPQPSQQTPAAQSSSQTQSSKWSAADRARAVAKHVGKKDVRLAKIVEYAKVHGGKITNDEIEKLLHVSDATASRYAKVLVERDLLRAEGKGRAASYALL